MCAGEQVIEFYDAKGKCTYKGPPQKSSVGATNAGEGEGLSEAEMKVLENISAQVDTIEKNICGDCEEFKA